MDKSQSQGRVGRAIALAETIERESGCSQRYAMVWAACVHKEQCTLEEAIAHGRAHVEAELNALMDAEADDRQARQWELLGRV